MKNKVLVVFFSILCFTFCANAQNILKGKKLKNQIQKIDSLIQVKQYERAINILENQENVILEENIPKKMLDLFINDKRVLAEKKEIFNKNKDVVLNLKSNYDTKKFCEAIKLLDLDLNYENCFADIIQVKSNLVNDLIIAKAKCIENSQKIDLWEKMLRQGEYEELYGLLDMQESEKNYFSYNNDQFRLNELLNDIKYAKNKGEEYSTKIKDWQKMYNDTKYENLYSLIEFDESEKKYFTKQNIEDFNKLILNLKDKHTKYIEVKSYLDCKVGDKILNFDYNLLDENQAKSILDTLKINISLSRNKLNDAPGLNPQLENDYNKQLIKVNNSIEKLNALIIELRAKKEYDDKIKAKESSYGASAIDFNRLKFASRLLDASYENQSSKPIYSKKCFDDAAKIIESELVLFKKYKYPFVYHSTIVSLDQFSYHVDQEEKFDDDYLINYDNDIVFEFIGKNMVTKYPTSDDVLEKLENLPDGGSYTAILQITPVIFFKKGYSISEGSRHMTIYVKIIDIY